MNILLNALLFQAVWIACVLGAAKGMPMAGVVALGLALAVHLWRARRPARELLLVTLVGIGGGVWDSLLVVHAGFHYASGAWAVAPAPYWIFAMWLAFATTLNVSLRWLRGRPLLGAALGAVGGPLAFHAGERLGAVRFDDPTVAMIVLAAGWAVLMPGASALARRLDRMAPATPPGSASRAGPEASRR